MTANPKDAAALLSVQLYGTSRLADAFARLLTQAVERGAVTPEECTDYYDELRRARSQVDAHQYWLDRVTAS